MSDPVANQEFLKRFNVTVTGCDGSLWHVSGDKAGSEGVLLCKEFSGVYDAPVTTIRQTTARGIGAQYLDHKFEPRTLVLKFDVKGGNRDRWVEIDSAFRQAWDYSRSTRITFNDRVAGTTRYLDVMLSEAPSDDIDQNTFLIGFSTVGITCIADNPMWLEEDIAESFIFDGLHYKHEMTVENPSDQPMFLYWVVKSPLSVILPDWDVEAIRNSKGFELDSVLDYRFVVLPHAGPGMNFIVDTQPDARQIIAPGFPSFWAQMRGQYFEHVIPPYTPPTKLPVYVNPLPWLQTLFKTLDLPMNAPVPFYLAVAEALQGTIGQIPQSELLTHDFEWLAGKIDEAITSVNSQFDEFLTPAIRSRFKVSSIASLLNDAYTVIGNLPGGGVECRQIRRWSRPWGLSRND